MSLGSSPSPSPPSSSSGPPNPAAATDTHPTSASSHAATHDNEAGAPALSKSSESLKQSAARSAAEVVRRTHSSPSPKRGRVKRRAKSSPRAAPGTAPTATTEQAARNGKSQRTTKSPRRQQTAPAASPRRPKPRPANDTTSTAVHVFPIVPASPQPAVAARTQARVNPGKSHQASGPGHSQTARPSRTTLGLLTPPAGSSAHSDTPRGLRPHSQQQQAQEHNRPRIRKTPDHGDTHGRGRSLAHSRPRTRTRGQSRSPRRRRIGRGAHEVDSPYNHAPTPPRSTRRSQPTHRRQAAATAAAAAALRASPRSSVGGHAPAPAHASPASTGNPSEEAPRRHQRDGRSSPRGSPSPRSGRHAGGGAGTRRQRRQRRRPQRRTRRSVSSLSQHSGGGTFGGSGSPLAVTSGRRSVASVMSAPAEAGYGASSVGGTPRGHHQATVDVYSASPRPASRRGGATTPHASQHGGGAPARRRKKDQSTARGARQPAAAHNSAATQHAGAGGVLHNEREGVSGWSTTSPRQQHAKATNGRPPPSPQHPRQAAAASPLPSRSTLPSIDARSKVEGAARSSTRQGGFCTSCCACWCATVAAAHHICCCAFAVDTVIHLREGGNAASLEQAVRGYLGLPSAPFLNLPPATYIAGYVVR